MGMYVSFVRLTPAELEKATQDASWAEKFVENFYNQDPFDPPADSHLGLDKTWDGLNFLFGEAEVDLDILMAGHTIIGEDGYHLAGWSAELVKRTAEKLRNTPFEKLAAVYDPDAMTEVDVYPGMWEHDPDDELELLREYYEDMVTFFTKAAEQGAAALMSFG